MMIVMSFFLLIRTACYRDDHVLHIFACAVCAAIYDVRALSVDIWGWPRGLQAE